MKTIISVFLSLIIFLLGSICGFFVSKNFNIDLQNGTMTSRNEIVESQNDTKEPQNEIAGTYRSDNWYGGISVIVIYDDGTCIGPFGKEGKWTVDGKTIHLVNEDATIVPNGIMLRGIFFQKV